MLLDNPNVIGTHGAMTNPLSALFLAIHTQGCTQVTQKSFEYNKKNPFVNNVKILSDKKNK